MATIGNVTATIENLNQIGTISPTSTTFSSATTGAIPFDNVGLYQIMDKLVSEVLTVKNTIKTNEKNLIKDLAIDPDDTTVTLTNSVGAATHGSSIANHKARNRLVDDALKPAIFGSGSSIRYSEDGLFTMFSSITYEIMKLRNGLAAANNGGVSANAGLQPIPVSTGTV